MLSGGEAGYSEKGGRIGAKDLKNPQSSQKIKKTNQNNHSISTP